MKDALLDLNATVATVLDIATWIWIGAVLFLTGFAAWLLIAAVRRVIDSFTRANRLVAEEVGPDALRLLEDLDTHLEQHAANDPELAAAYQRPAADIRKEEQS